MNSMGAQACPLSVWWRMDEGEGALTCIWLDNERLSIMQSLWASCGGRLWFAQPSAALRTFEAVSEKLRMRV